MKKKKEERRAKKNKEVNRYRARLGTSKREKGNGSGAYCSPCVDINQYHCLIRAPGNSYILIAIGTRNHMEYIVNSVYHNHPFLEGAWGY